jgi:hypothetical protein
MSISQFLLAAAVILLVLAAATAYKWRPNWDAPWSHTLGWLGLACFVLAGLLA